MHVQTYLFLEGLCQQALDYYQQHLGAEVLDVLRYEDNPEKPADFLPPNADKFIMHCSFRIGDVVLMASDGMCSENPAMNGFAISLSVDDVNDVDRLFKPLADGGEVQMAPEQTFWSPRFGMVKDRFGVSWMVGVMGEQNPG